MTERIDTLEDILKHVRNSGQKSDKERIDSLDITVRLLANKINYLENRETKNAG